MTDYENLDNITIIVNPSELYSTSAIVFVDPEETSRIGVSTSNATVFLGTSTTRGVLSTSMYITPGSVTTYTTNRPIDPPRVPPNEQPLFNVTVSLTTPSIETTSVIRDETILNVLEALNKTNDNIVNASSANKLAWSQTVLGTVNFPYTMRTIIKIRNVNYSKFGNTGNTNKTTTDRRRF